jgi:uncharacterized protein
VELPLLEVLLLAGAGAAGGYLAGLVGVGGGIIYGPVLLFYYRAIGIEDPLLTPLTVGTSLLCVCAAAISGVFSQRRTGAIRWRIALASGAVAAVTTLLTGRFITTAPWYDRQIFQIVLGAILVWVVIRMLRPRRLAPDAPIAGDGPARPGLAPLAGIGAGVGVLVAAAGVGGGVLLVPLYSGLLKLPLKTAMATSLAAILVVSVAGVGTYVGLGLGAEAPAGVLGYVDFYRGMLLGLPAIATARMGVWTARRVEARVVRYVFAAVAAIVAMRLIWEGIAG